MTNLELADKLQDAASSHYGDLCGMLWDAGAALRNLHTENTALRVTEDNLRQELQECQECQDQRRASFRRIEELDKELDAMRAQIGQGEPDGMVLVDRGALHMAINALRRDSEDGRTVRGEMADMLASAPQAPQAPQANKTHVLVPLRMTRAMQDVVSEEDWSWADLLAAAEAVTEDEFTAAEQTEPIMPQVSAVQQKPLTVEQIWENDALMALNAEAGLSMTMLEKIVGIVEAAHNIGETK